MVVTFYNGSKTKEAWNPDSPEFIEGWKPETLEVHCESLILTYGNLLRLFKVNGTETWTLHIIDRDGFVKINDTYYGDWSCK